METNGKLVVSTDELPWEVKAYALAGAVNVHVSMTTFVISIPVGCTMRLLCKLGNKATSADNMKEFESFRIASRSVGTEKGHFFERLVACELSFLSSKLYKVLLSTTGMGFSPDPRTTGNSFLYHPRIHEADWSVGRVYCVEENARHNGHRLVDVGFPVTGGGASWKFFCELKVVQDQNELWRMCWTFFKKMQDIGVGQNKEKTTAVFLSCHDFMNHEPNQKEVTKGLSAHDSRIRVLKLLRENRKCFAVVDGNGLVKANTVLPLVDLYSIIDRKEPTDAGATELSDKVGLIYASSSQPGGSVVDESEQKKQRIS